MFWYAIEKLFELHIGLTLQQIVLIGVLAQFSRLIFELPTSILADRWNRRKILLLSYFGFALCALILGLSNGLGIYLFGTIIWGLASALGSGTYEAFTYDTLATNGLKEHFRKIYSRMFSIELMTLSIASIIAGIMSHFFGLRVNFFITILPMVFGMFMVLSMKEPDIIRTIHNDIDWIRHLSGSFRVIKGRHIRPVFTIFVFLAGFQTLWYEYYQLVGISAKLPLVVYSALLSIITLGVAAGSEVSYRIQLSPRIITLAWSLLFVTQVIGLRLHTMVAVLITITFVSISFGMLRVYLQVFLQHNIDSSRRATILSLGTSMGYGIFIISGLLLTLMLSKFGITWSITILALPLIILGIIDIAKGMPWARTE